MTNYIEYFQNEINKYDESVFHELAERKNPNDFADMLCMLIIHNDQLANDEELIDQYYDQFVSMLSVRAKQFGVNM
jgi:hypothetical protein